MSDKTISVVLQNAYGSYSNRIVSVLNLIQRDTKSIHANGQPTQNYRILLKFAITHHKTTDSSFASTQNILSMPIWELFMEYARCRDAKVITSNDVYVEYKSSFPNTKYKFIRRIGNEPIMSRLISILNVRESQECISTIDVSYVEHQECDISKCTLTPTYIYRLRRTTLKLFAWDVSLCEYTYGTALDDTRLQFGPKDRIDVEALYVDNTTNLRENLFKLLAIISPDYDYTKLLFKTHSILPVSRQPPILITNRIMNQINPNDVAIYNTQTTDFITLYSYKNLWKRGDFCVMVDSKELLYEKSKPIDTALTKLDDIELAQTICVVNGDKYERVMTDDDAQPELRKLITTPIAIKVRPKENWNDIIKRTNGKFVVVTDSQLYYYNKDVVKSLLIMTDQMAMMKSAILWNKSSATASSNEDTKASSFHRPNNSEQNIDTLDDDVLFRKLSFRYNNRYYPLTSMHSKMSNVFRYVYQYIFEDVFTKNPHDAILHIFDSNAISSSELVRLCNTKVIITVGDIPSTEEYINDIYYSRPIITFYSTATIYKSIPKVEIVNDFDGNAFISQLIKCTSFIPNSLDIVYIENCFTMFNTIPKFNTIVASIPQLLNRRGKLFVAYINANTITHVCAKYENVLYEMFEPEECLTTVPTDEHATMSVQINKRTITSSFLESVYNVRKNCINVNTIVVSKSNIETTTFDKYEYNGEYIYSLDTYSPKIKEYVRHCLSTNKNAMGVITIQDLSYVAIDPAILNTIGNITYTITPYRTPIVSQYLSQAHDVWRLLNKENEPILSSLQMAIIELE